MSRLLVELQKLPGAEERPSQFNGEPALWVDGREFLHFHGPEEVEIRLTRGLISRLDEPRVWRRTPHSDWVGVGAGEVDLAVQLARQALEANRR